jgi:hypothetical protein
MWRALPMNSQNTYFVDPQEQYSKLDQTEDRLCGLVIRVPGYRFRGPGSIPSATRFSEK